jgi:phosphoribosylformylglycinamidine synthase
MKAQVYVTTKEGILDPQGRTVHKALTSLGISAINNVHMGKFIELDLEDMDETKARTVTTEACDRLLVNSNIESYRFEIVED